MSASKYRFGRIGAFVVSIFLLLAVAGVPGASAAPAFVPGYTTVNAPLAVQPQWQRLLTSAALQPGNAMALWADLHRELIDQHPLRQLDQVNRYFNRIRYAEDSAIYGASDYWASPAEFVQRDFGDCEDYSIAKYTALRALGWSAESLLIVVLRDHKYSVDHAVLAAKFEGKWHLLDNRAPHVLAPSEVPFYQPVYAVNEDRLTVFEKVWATQEATLNKKRERASNGSPG